MLKIQNLLYPNTGAELLQQGVWLPEGLREAFENLFQFDCMGAAEFEGDKTFQALQKFYKFMQSGDLCEMRYQAELDGADELRVICPISKAREIVLFLDDQCCEQPTWDTVKSTGIRETITGAEFGLVKKAGWFDHDHSAFIFADRSAAIKFTVMFGLESAPYQRPFPVINQDFQLEPQIGIGSDQHREQLRSLSRIWNIPMRTSYNNGRVNIEVVPEA